MTQQAESSIYTFFRVYILQSVSMLFLYFETVGGDTNCVCKNVEKEV